MHNASVDYMYEGKYNGKKIKQWTEWIKYV